MTYHCRIAVILLFLNGCSQERLPRAPEPGLLGEGVVREGLAIEAPHHTPGKVKPLHSLFISGHSLVDQPFPDQLAAIGAALDRPLRWQRRFIPGSSIRHRSNLPGPDGVFDASLITEQHGVIGSLVWNDTVQQLRNWHDSMNIRSPGIVTFFYMPWLPIDDKDDPLRWIAYEQAAANVWQCIATRVNSDLAAQQRTDRIVTIPASLALAFLIEQLTLGRRMAGAEGTGLRKSIDAYFSDDVHLTPLGSYYVAQVTYAGMAGASIPDMAGNEQERFLAEVARQFLDERAAVRLAMSIPNCQRYIQRTFQEDYWDYARRTILTTGSNPLRAWWSAHRMQSAAAKSGLLLLE